MAEIEHIRLLCQGRDAWNSQRREQDFVPNLTHIDIRGADLHGADLERADFDGSILSLVDLHDARLQRARLNGVTVSRSSFSRASMAGVELKGADLKRVSLAGADLRGAVGFDLKIRHADLDDANFRGVKLRYAHFYNSSILGADFDDASLEHVVLKRVVLDEPQRRSLKELGCGIELANQPTPTEWLDWSSFDIRRDLSDFGVIVYQGKAYWISEGRWDFFISHASVDKESVAGPLAEALRARDQRVWIDDLVVRPGDDLTQVIDFGTRSSLFGVIVISKSFFGRKWTEAELDALSEKRLFLVLHEVTPQELQQLRPELENRVSISTAVGIDRIAQSLVEATQKPPQDL